MDSSSPPRSPPRASHLDFYQLTSLVPHWDSGRAGEPVSFTFFSRKLPTSPHTGQVARGYVLWVGLRRCLRWLEAVRFDDELLRRLKEQPVLGPALRNRPDLVDALARWRFSGRISAPPEGTPLRMGRALDPEGTPVEVRGVRPASYTPYLQVDTDLLSAKLIETPLLSIINHQSMVATKASRVARAAGDRPVAEFGTRRNHPHAAVDAAYAAWVGGCAGTSNVEAWRRLGIPLFGTMDHFAIQAWERPGVPRHETEAAYFRSFHQAFPRKSFLLVDTYDTFGERTGIRNAIRATGANLVGVRLDSDLTVENVRRARHLLDRGGAPQARILLSGGLDEYALERFREAPADAYGVGERLVTSADAPVGVNAVAKLTRMGGVPTTKLSRGSGKAHLPGRLQVFRDSEGRDTVVEAGERAPGEPLLRPVWDETGPRDLPEPGEVRDHARRALEALPPSFHEPTEHGPRLGPALHRRFVTLVKEA